MSEHAKTVSVLNSELQQIDIELQQIAEQEREAERGIGELSLQARRGDRKAAAKLDQFDKFAAEATAARRRLKTARVGVEAELATAVAIKRAEEAKSKAREAQEVLRIFRERGSAIDQAFQRAIDEYFNLLADAQRLENLGATINADLVGANCRRVVRAALRRLKIEGVDAVPPLDRHSFSELTGKWAGTADRWIAGVLGEPTPSAVNGHAAAPVEAGTPSEIPPAAARSPSVAPHRNIHVDDGSDPNFEIKPVLPRAS